MPLSRSYGNALDCLLHPSTHPLSTLYGVPVTPLYAALIVIILGLAPMAVGFVFLVRNLTRQNDRLMGEQLATLRRATMPIVTVGEDVLDQPVTPEMAAYLAQAFGPGAGSGVIGHRPFGDGGFGAESGSMPAMPHDPTDALMPDPDPMDNANRAIGGDDPDWPYPGAGEHR